MKNETCQLTAEQTETLMNDWIPFIRAVVRKCGVPHDLREDLVQGVVLDIIEGDYMNIYDPNKAALSTYLYAMTRKRVMGRTSRRGKDALKHSVLIGDRDWVTESYEPQSLGEFEERQTFWGKVQLAKEQMRLTRPRRPYKGENGEVIPRSNADVFDAIIQGKTQAQIARAMHYSEATVSVIMSEIREMAEVIELQACLTV